MALTILDAQLRQAVLKQMPALRFSRRTEHFQRRQRTDAAHFTAEVRPPRPIA